MCGSHGECDRLSRDGCVARYQVGRGLGLVGLAMMLAHFLIRFAQTFDTTASLNLIVYLN